MAMSKLLFQNKVVWITGASSGIGEALAYAFNREGAKLILSARRQPELERVKKQCPNGPADGIAVLPLDLNELDTLGDKSKQALSAFGQVDILINNGGIGQRGRAVETILKVDRLMMNVNYLSHVALTKYVLPSMLERKAGHIVVVSSLMGELYTAKRSAYAATKHALHGFFDCLRAEVAPYGVRVTIASPGWVRTNISFNALRGDGTTFGKMDTEHANAISAAECAEGILRAVANKKAKVYIGGAERYGVLVRRLLPGLYDRFIGRVRVT